MADFDFSSRCIAINEYNGRRCQSGIGFKGSVERGLCGRHNRDKRERIKYVGPPLMIRRYKSGRICGLCRAVLDSYNPSTICRVHAGSNVREHRAILRSLTHPVDI